jgi:hypothetical protein
MCPCPLSRCMNLDIGVERPRRLARSAVPSPIAESSGPSGNAEARGRVALLLLAVAVAAATALLLTLDSHLTFISDDWELLANRQGWNPAVFLDPFSEHPVVLPVLIFKLTLALFGMRSATPFYVTGISLLMLSNLLLFFYLRRRVGDWLALIGVVLVLFLGAAYSDFLWVFPMTLLGSMASGLGMLLALDRGDTRGDRLACALAVVSIAFSALGLAFVVGAFADLWFGARPRRRRAYIALVPLAVYAGWWLGWGHTSDSYLSLHNLVHLPAFVFDSAAAGVTSLAGQDPSLHLGWGRVLLIFTIFVGAIQLYRRGRISRGFAVALAVAFAFWVFGGIDRSPLRTPFTSRYQYISAVLLLLIAAELLRGVRARTPALLAISALSAIAVTCGINLLIDTYNTDWKPESRLYRSTLAAMDIAGSSARSQFSLTFPPKVAVRGSTYLAAAHRYGSPGFSAAELAEQGEEERVRADRTLARALPIGLVPAINGPTRQRPPCRMLPASPTGFRSTRLRAGTFELVNGSDTAVGVRLGRFSPNLPVELGSLDARSADRLTIPSDNSVRPWIMGLKGSGSVRLCNLEAG